VCGGRDKEVGSAKIGGVNMAHRRWQETAQSDVQRTALEEYLALTRELLRTGIITHFIAIHALRHCGRACFQIGEQLVRLLNLILVPHRPFLPSKPVRPTSHCWAIPSPARRHRRSCRGSMPPAPPRSLAFGRVFYTNPWPRDAPVGPTTTPANDGRSWLPCNLI